MVISPDLWKKIISRPFFLLKSHQILVSQSFAFIGFKTVRIYQIGNGIPNFLHLFRPSQIAALSKGKLIVLLPPNFSEEGNNVRRFETEIYIWFSRYTRLAASGQRGSITLGHILQYITGTDKEPPLGFGVVPCIEFVEATSHGTNPHTNAHFYLLRTLVQIHCVY